MFNQEKEEIEKRELRNSSPTKDHSSLRITNQTIEERGKEDAEKSHATKTEKDRRKLENMVADSNRVLTTTSSVFPWTLFPTVVSVEATRINIVYRQSFTTQAHSVDIKDISNVFIETGILFATITIISRTFTENNIKVSGIWKKDAIFVRRIIEGLRMLTHENMDTANYTRDELIQKLKQLSTTKIV